MKKVMSVALIATMLVLAGCNSLYKGAVTVTKVRDTAMKELAQLNKQGKISPATDAKITVADAQYRTAAEVAVKALEAYKASGDKVQYLAALQAVKAAVGGILDILVPMIPQSEAVTLQSDLVKAVQL